MKVLVVGSGGREHALAWKLKQSKQVEYIYLAPGNPGMADLGELVPIAVDAIDQLTAFAVEHAIDLTVVGPETTLCAGIVDAFKAKGLRCFGPSKAAAELEGSKVVMKEFLRRHNIPTAQFKIFTKATDAHDYVEENDGPLVVKCDGLAAGKGVTVAKDAAEAHDAITRIMEKHEFGVQAGKQIVIEEILRGEEISVFAFCDGHNAVLCDYVQDHKQAFDGDEGPNTGGMGTFSPARLMKTRDEDELVRRIVVPTMSGLVKEGRPYTGILFIGLMLTDAGPKVLEYNVRFGDPECQVLMMRLQEDLVDICNACIDGTLDNIDLTWKADTAVCVTMAAPGYPGNYPKNSPITGIDKAKAKGCTVFHAGTAHNDNDVLVTNGGRVLSVCASGKDIDDARTTAYAGCDLISFTGKHFRKDIGKRREARKAT